jgi:hypothetical protein
VLVRSRLKRSQVDASGTRSRCARLRKVLVALTGVRGRVANAHAERRGFLLHGVAACVHAGGEAAFEGGDLLVVGGLVLAVGLLLLGGGGLRALLLRLFIRRALATASAYGADGGAEGCALARVAADGAQHGSAGCAAGGSAHAATLRLGRFGCTLLRGCLLLRGGGTCGGSGLGIDARLLLHGVVASGFVDELLVARLIVLGIDEHADLLRGGEGGHGCGGRCRWRWCGAAGRGGGLGCLGSGFGFLAAGG